ncbi:MAG: carbohydrate-binding domain-containing protein [Clostridiales Family XIII bacterium]|jgi:hypothetical protein|nr:carbohydrate-binding domain-containing protein [Clostridiales Family XIII bacterium]
MKRSCCTISASVFAIFAILSGFVLFSGCAAQSGTAAEEGSAEAENPGASERVPLADAPYRNSVDEEDSESAWDAAASVGISLNKTSVSVDGEGATVDGSVVTVDKAGTYVLTGSLQDGQVIVAAASDDTVRLVLNGVDISSFTGAPIYASQCNKLILTLADGTENSVTDGGENFAYANEGDEEPDAAVFCKDDLTINGSGTLTVNAGFNNGVGTKDDLVVTGGNLLIKAANNGLRGNDSVTVLAGTFAIDAGNDGVQTNNGTDAEKGWIYIADGAFDIRAAHDGIQAEAGLYIDGGVFDIVAGGGSDEAQILAADAAGGALDAGSFKGIKAAGDILVSGGDFTVDSADDAIHANADIAVDGGKFTLATDDDGIHADGDLRIGGGEIEVKKSYEGLEAANIRITDGTVGVVASDDGINAAGGSDGNTDGGRFGGDAFRADGDYSVNISGGSVRVLAGVDGVDSNGVINISGGYSVMLSSSARGGGDAALDANGALTFTGGSIIYGGGLNTGAGPGGDSTQSCVYTEAEVAAGSEVSVRKDGQSLIAFKPDIDCLRLAFSSPDIVSGESYEIYSGERLIAEAMAGIGGGMRGNGMPGGERPGNGMPEGGEMPEGGIPEGGERPGGGMPGGGMPEGGERPEGGPGRPGGGMPGGERPGGGEAPNGNAPDGGPYPFSDT